MPDGSRDLVVDKALLLADRKMNAAAGVRVAFHPPCTLQHGLKIRGVVEAAQHLGLHLDVGFLQSLRRVLGGDGAHQGQALDAVRAGRDVCVVTPTASGKSLCYELPVLQALADDPSARALWLFPTKALGEDQVVAFRELAAAGDAVKVSGASFSSPRFSASSSMSLNERNP